ncbi:unnamed protein product [Prorocentrum cordatum]|uniref:Uncharacterized protein n=1 Tax=Prorocentrum cordatum TaxID=2364126 RepID=A0ABN9W853_9DINO|nr:unnamed protein product [Polarella glacialis]
MTRARYSGTLPRGLPARYVLRPETGAGRQLQLSAKGLVGGRNLRAGGGVEQTEQNTAQTSALGGPGSAPGQAPDLPARDARGGQELRWRRLPWGGQRRPPQPARGLAARVPLLPRARKGLGGHAGPVRPRGPCWPRWESRPV